MIRIARNLSFALLVVSVAYAAAQGTIPGAVISGTVKDPAGAPFQGAFVRAQNAKTKITTIVLSDRQGRYRAESLPPGEYQVRATAVGYKEDLRGSVQIAAGKAATLDLALPKGIVRWSDLNTYQGRQLLPKTANHDLSYRDVFMTSCFQSCHSFQKTMAPYNWDKSGWVTRVRYMRDVIMGGEDSRLTDERVDDFASYMTAAFGPGSKPESPAALPEYKNLVRSASDAAADNAAKIVYVEYEFRGAKGLGPWSAVEGNDGMVWIPYHNRGNEVVRLHPETGELKRFALPFTETAGIHSAIPASDGTVWFTEADQGRVGRLNPRTGEITEYQNTLPNGRRAGSHTVRVDERGYVWTSGGPLGRMATSGSPCSGKPMARLSVSPRTASCPSSRRPQMASRSAWKWMTTASFGSPSAAVARSDASIPRPKRSRSTTCPALSPAPMRSALTAISGSGTPRTSRTPWDV